MRELQSFPAQSNHKQSYCCLFVAVAVPAVAVWGSCIQATYAHPAQQANPLQAVAVPDVLPYARHFFAAAKSFTALEPH
jgi:hypothetical protein